MGLSRKSKHGKPSPVMNVTPLVDVVLVLLIIFMVILPAINSDLNVEMANIQNPDEDRKNEPEPFVLSIDVDGKYYLDEKRIENDQLGAHLRAANANEPNRRLVLRGDRRLNYESVRELMAVVQDVGFPGVALRVSKTVADDASDFAKSVHGKKGS